MKTITLNDLRNISCMPVVIESTDEDGNVATFPVAKATVRETQGRRYLLLSVVESEDATPQAMLDYYHGTPATQPADTEVRELSFSGRA